MRSGVRAALSPLVIAFASACATGGPTPAPTPGAAPPAAVALRNADFEQPSRQGERCPAGWACKMHADPESFRFTLDPERPAEGRQSLRIERRTREPWAVATQVVRPPALDALKGRRVRVSLAVRVDGATGKGAGPWTLVHGPRGNLAHAKKLVKGSQDWERLAVEVDVAPSALMLEVGATLEGPGRVWIDDLRVEVR